MGCRGRLVLLLVLGVATVAVAPAASGPPRVGSSFYLAQPDPRLCPSPLCGGYWVALANRARTRCPDGVLRARCYVARTVGEDRHPLPAGVPSDALTRAAVEPWRFEGFGELGVLVVARVFAPAGRASPVGRYFRVVDTGIRCVRAPCFSLRASQLNGGSVTKLSGVDLRSARMEAAELAQAEAELAASGGLLLQGRITPTTDGGRELRATRVFLREPPPRA